MTTQHKPVSTIDFTPDKDNWVHLSPLGTFPHPNGLLQQIDEKAVASMVNRFNAEKTEAGEGFAGVLLDYDHFSGNKTTPSEAAGWITDLENRGADGLWGKVRYSDTGVAAVKGGRYRFTSPSWKPADCEIVNRATKTVRPLRLDRAALTNDPNFKGMEPITNRADEFAGLLKESPATQEEPMRARAMTRADLIDNAGTIDGAHKGHATRRARGRAATKDDVKKTLAAQEAAKAAAPKRAATKADLKKVVGAKPPPLPLMGTPERAALSAGKRAPTKADFAAYQAAQRN